MIRASRSIISDLVKRGVDFERDQAGNLRYTREGAHSRPRICFHSDITGDEITSTLLTRVRDCPPSASWNTLAWTISWSRRITASAASRRRAAAVSSRMRQTGRSCASSQARRFWACGGIGGTYPRSTNFPSLTGDACAIAARHGIALEHMDYVQIHPTSLYSTQPGRAFLISESCRGEGAVLLDANGKRFTDELQPRDVVSAAIYRQMAAEGSNSCASPSPTCQRTRSRDTSRISTSVAWRRGSTSRAGHPRRTRSTLLHGRRAGGLQQRHGHAGALRRGRDQLQRRAREEPPGQQLAA